MYRIGEFSNLSKTTIKTLRYYEKEGLLIPAFIDNTTGYRFYETYQLISLARIIALRQIGMPIKKIKAVFNDSNYYNILLEQKKDLEKDINLYNEQLSRIKYLLEEKEMKYEPIIKNLPEYVIYYKEGVIKDFNELVNFILSSAEECRKTNPNIKCLDPDYCYVSYLDNEYKDKDIKVRYSQAVTEEGIPNETIKFEKLDPVKGACIYHKGSYSTLREAYSFIIKWIEDNGYKISGPIRERYIDGMWNKEDENDWLTEIQVPID